MDLKKLLDGVELTKESFKNPPKELGILPFWFWNGELKNEELEWQLKEYHSKGIPGVFIHGRFGLKVPYLSEEWFEKVRYVVGKAKEIGIDTWVYDEMNWPSGTAERKVPTEFPQFRQRYLELVALRVDGPLFNFLEATDNRYVNTGDSYPIAAFGCTEEEFQNGIRNPIDLTQNLSFDRIIPWEAPPGKWRLLYFLEKEVPYYIDALNPESTDKFIELTHEKYKASVGAEFGKTLPGFYTDEPAMHYYHVGLDNFVIPWTKKMFKIFRERRGYDLRPLLPALYANMGDKTARIRYDFWRTLSEQYSEIYYKKLRKWCDDNGVIFTGHLLFEEWIRLHARCEGNIFDHLKHMHIIGVDHLYPKIGTQEEPDQHVALKIASSAAHFFGSKRVLCESMGGTYWDCSLERMKWILNWEYVLGVNLFNNHGYHYSIEGERKRDWPPSQFYHHTWWKYYDLFTNYSNRLSHLLTGGTHVAKVLVLYPITSIWTNYVPQERNAIGNLIESDFYYLTDTLLRLHYDFDFVDEERLAQAKTENGKLKIADETYSVLIMPPMTHVRKTTLGVLKSFLNSGGSVIADTLLPVELVDDSKGGAARNFNKLFGADPLKLLENFIATGSSGEGVTYNNSKGHAFLLKGPGLSSNRSNDDLRRTLSKCIKPDVTISDGDIFYLHRRKDGYEIYFLANTSKEAKKKVEVSFENVSQPELWNPESGETTPIHVYEIREKRLHITLDFAAAESKVIVLRGEPAKEHIVKTDLDLISFGDPFIKGSSASNAPIAVEYTRGKSLVRKQLKPIPQLKPLVFGKQAEFSAEQDNVLAISKWKMYVGHVTEKPEEISSLSYDDSGWLSVSNGAWEMQLPQERDSETYPVNLWYRTAFFVDEIPNKLRVLVDGFSGSNWRMFFNGMEVKDRGRRSWLDAEIKEVDIQQNVKIGKNVLLVNLEANKRTDGILDLLKIVGRFSVAEKRDGFHLEREPGSIEFRDWTEQGLPYFSGTGVYKVDIDIPSKYLSGRLFLEVECGEDVLEVNVNNGSKIVVPWHPYRVDITPFVKAGRNMVVMRVTNSLINILEGIRKPSGLLAPPKIFFEPIYSVDLK